MFVRWKRKKLAVKRWRKEDGDCHSLYAVLVQSKRVNGQPRQKVIKHLATIEERLMFQAFIRAIFWREVQQKLTELELDERTRTAIATTLAKRVPMPTQAEQEEEVARFKLMQQRIRQRL